MQMRADREKRAVILTAEGSKQSQILIAEGAKQAAILSAEGDAKAEVVRAEGEARAVTEIFDAVRAAKLDEKMLAYRYLEQLPELAKGDANKVWFVPSELTGAMRYLAEAFTKKSP
jgi:regulator of protease activity HflC (stomatin/prohibitin superfamily)